MTEVSRQQRQPGLHVAAVAIPAKQCSDRESVPKIMNSWSA